MRLFGGPCCSILLLLMSTLLLQGCASSQKQSSVVADLTSESQTAGSKEQSVKQQFPLENVLELEKPPSKEVVSAAQTKKLDAAQTWSVKENVSASSKTAEIVLILKNTLNKPLSGVSFVMNDKCSGDGPNAIEKHISFVSALAPGTSKAYQFKIEFPPKNTLRKEKRVCGTVTRGW